MAGAQKGVVQRVPAPPTPIAGTFTFPGNRKAPNVPLPLMVRRPHTNPARVEVKIGVSRRFRGTGGTLEESGKVAAIRWFDRAEGGTAIVLAPTGLPLTAAQLNKGVHLFAESDVPSDSVGDYVLTLVLAGGPDPLGNPPASVGLTAVRVTLDVFPPGPRFGPGAPAPLPEPPATAPPAGVETDKWFLGRTVNVQDIGLAQERARLRIGQVQPFNFVGNLSIRQRALSGTTLGKDSARAALFDDETPPPFPGTPANLAHVNPFSFAAPGILGLDVFVEGRALSAARRDVAFQLGLDPGEPDGDRVAFTIGVGCSITIENALRAVIVKKAHTAPGRQAITLRTNVAFGGKGSFEVTAGNIPPKVQFFDAFNGGPALPLPIVAPGAQLSAPTGFQLFVEGIARSGSVDELALSLMLADGAPPAGLPATAKMTAVELTLDVFLSRPLAGGVAPQMPTADKVNAGRFVQVASPTLSHERAKLIVRPPNPDLPCDLVVRALGTPRRVRLFADEVPAEGQREIDLPDKLFSGIVAIGGGLDRFAEGIEPSAAPGDAILQLGIDTLEDDGDRVPMTALDFAATENATAAAPVLPAVRFGLWNRAYDPGPAIAPNQTTLRANFIDNDRRRFHFQVRGPLPAKTLEVSWRTLRADRITADDSPGSKILTLASVPGGRLVSPGAMLVIDEVDAKLPTPAARGSAEHRLRIAKIDGFVRADIQPATGQFHHLVIPVFDRAVPFETTSPSVMAGGSVMAVVVAATKGTAATGARWQIKKGSELTVDVGPNQEVVTVAAVTSTGFAAIFANPHDGSAAPFRIAGRTDERRRLQVRVVRYNNANDPNFKHAKDFLVAKDGDLRSQFEHANLRWNQVGLQIDQAGKTADRQIPNDALNADGKYPDVTAQLQAGSTKQERAILADLIPITPDNTVTAVFLDMDGANAYAEIIASSAVPFPVPGGTVSMGDRFFIFLQSRLDALDETLAHELYHVLHNRFHDPTVVVADHFFTYNTSRPTSLAFARSPSITLPDARIYRRIHVLHSADPDRDPNNDNILNWFRRPRTARFPNVLTLQPATATTGNNLTEDF